MRRKARGRGWILSATTLLSVMGLVAVVPTPTLGQTRPNASRSQQLPQGKRQPTTVNGRLDSNSPTLPDKRYYNVHTFEGKAGEQITIELTSKEFNASLILLSPNDKKIGENNNKSNARITAT